MMSGMTKAGTTTVTARVTLAAPRSATALDRPVGQWLTNQRRPGALAGHPKRAEALADLDPDWNPAWPLDWQRQYAGLRQIREARVPVEAIEPGTTIDGDDIGRWLAKQRTPEGWARLSGRQQEMLTDVEVRPLPAPAPQEAAKAPGGAVGVFGRGVCALAQYKARTGSVTVSRGHVEVLAGSPSTASWPTPGPQAGGPPERDPWTQTPSPRPEQEEET